MDAMSMRAGAPVAGLSGVVGVVLNIAAVVLLRPMPHAYRPDGVPEWLQELVTNPGPATGSAWCFTLGLVAFVPFAVAMVSFADEGSRDAALSGAALLSAGALLNAAGTLAPIAAQHLERPVGEGALWASLLLDAAFNGFLGLALLLLTWSSRRSAPRGFTALGFIAGLASLPVVMEFTSATAVTWLGVAGPLWLAWVTWASIRVARG